MRYDLAIIGGGVIGLSCAWHVQRARPDWKLAVIDRPTQSGQASWAAAGMLAPACEFNEASTLFELARASRDYYPRFLQAILESEKQGQEAQTLADSFGWREKGALVPAQTKDEVEHLEKKQAWLAEQGIAAEVVDRSYLNNFAPGLSSSVLSALWLPNEATVNSRALHSHLLQACRDDGVAIIESSVEAVEPGGGGWTLHTAVDTQSPNKVEKISADRLLVAAGAWSQQLGKLLQLSFPVEPVKGQLMRVDLPEKTLGCIVHRHEFYIAPRTGQGVIIGATMEEKGFDTELNESVFEEYFEMAAEVLPALSDQKIAEKWAGLRPRPIDGQPILGDVAATLVPESPPLFVATGHFRNGILLTPITGALLADRITESNAHAALYHSIDFSPFAPDRFISAPIN